MNRIKINTLIVIFLLSLSSILNILEFLTDRHTLVIKVSIVLILFFILIFLNCFKLNTKPLILLYIFVVFYTLNLILVDYKLIVTTEFIKFFVFGILIMI